MLGSHLPATDNGDVMPYNHRNYALTEIKKLGQQHAATRRQLLDDRDLSTEGRTRKLGELRAQTSSRVEQLLRGYVAQIDLERGNYEREIFGPPKTANPQSYRAALTEVAELEGEALDRFARIAATAGDTLAQRAAAVRAVELMQSAPPVPPGLLRSISTQE